MIRKVLTIDAPMMGSHWALMSPRQLMRPTPAGTKKNPRFFTRKSDTRSTHIRRTMRSLRAAVSSSIPMMLDGTGTPVAHTINSPIARKANKTAHCRIIVL